MVQLGRCGAARCFAAGGCGACSGEADEQYRVSGRLTTDNSRKYNHSAGRLARDLKKMSMENTDKKEKVYLVSFGNSDKYVLRDGSVGKESELTKIESELNSFLRQKFPDETFAYFTTPRVDEIAASHVARYASYPELDSAAITSIKEVLAREVKEMEANKNLNSDAPYANVKPAAADIPHILG